MEIKRPMSRILLVEDHERLASLIVEHLAGFGIAIDCVGRIDEAWHVIQEIRYSALILDRGLPDGDGVVLLRRLRQANQTIPCLVLTARDALHDRVDGLDSGADDYLTKPFAMDELVARVKALLRRPTSSVPLDPSYADLLLNTENSRLCCGDRGVTLAPAELQIMTVLVKKQGEVVRRRALEAAGWGIGEAVTPNAFDVALHRLRRKLLDLGTQLQIINVRNLGYALREVGLDQESGL